VSMSVLAVVVVVVVLLFSVDDNKLPKYPTSLGNIRFYLLFSAPARIWWVTKSRQIDLRHALLSAPQRERNTVSLLSRSTDFSTHRDG
jgi:hypothetical protein